MWPIGSAPEVEGTPPLWRIQRASAIGEYPPTGPPTARRTMGAPRVSNHMRHAPTGMPGGVDRNGARPLAGARDGHDALGRDHPRADGPPGGGGDRGATTRRHPGWRRHLLRTGWEPAGAPSRPARRPGTPGPPWARRCPGRRPARSGGGGRGRGPPGRRRGSLAGPSGGQASAGMACWLSIMSPMTILMNSSASSVIPPATPP